MARKTEIDWRLVEWAECRKAGLLSTEEVRETDRAINALPEGLKLTLTRYYVEADPGCLEATLSRRLGRIHLLLSEGLLEQSQRQREAQATRHYHSAVA